MMTRQRHRVTLAGAVRRRWPLMLALFVLVWAGVSAVQVVCR